MSTHEQPQQLAQQADLLPLPVKRRRVPHGWLDPGGVKSSEEALCVF